MTGRNPGPRARIATNHVLLVAVLLLFSGAVSLAAQQAAQTRPSSSGQADKAGTESPPPRTAPATLLERLRPYGDFRFRLEHDFQLDDKPDRTRARLRFRFGANFSVNDDFLFGARLVTGNPDDRKSTHVTLGDEFESLDVSLDRAFMTYQPKRVGGFQITGGKFAHPFYINPVYGELLWDADIQPEGLTTGYTWRNLGLENRIDLVGGWYVGEEQMGTIDATTVVVAQGVIRRRLTEKLSSAWAVGYYHYDDLTPGEDDVIFSENDGNAVVDRDGDGTADDFLSGFSILNPIVSLTFDHWGIPLVLSGEYILNTDAEQGLDQGWATGFTLGQTGKARSWLTYYQWQVVEQDSVLSLMSQDDSLFTTNHRSHLAGLRYQLLQRVEAHLWALASERDVTFPGVPTADSNAYQWRARLDFNVKF